MEDNFTPQQSLQLIQSMITRAKANLSENRFYFLLWGWVAFLCFTGQFVLKVFIGYERHYMVWLATIGASIVTIVRVRKDNRSGTRTYVGDSMSFLWMGLGISFFVLFFIFMRTPSSWQTAYPIYILFYALGTFVSGMLLKFKPLIIGGIINWGLALVCAWLPFDYQLLVAAAAVLTSYIIPGHLIKKENH
jgi:hypothetical protein